MAYFYKFAFLRQIFVNVTQQYIFKGFDIFWLEIIVTENKTRTLILRIQVLANRIIYFMINVMAS